MIYVELAAGFVIAACLFIFLAYKFHGLEKLLQCMRDKLSKTLVHCDALEVLVKEKEEHIVLLEKQLTFYDEQFSRSDMGRGGGNHVD